MDKELSLEDRMSAMIEIGDLDMKKIDVGEGIELPALVGYPLYECLRKEDLINVEAELGSKENSGYRDLTTIAILTLTDKGTEFYSDLKSIKKARDNIKESLARYLKGYK